MLPFPVPLGTPQSMEVQHKCLFLSFSASYHLSILCCLFCYYYCTMPKHFFLSICLYLYLNVCVYVFLHVIASSLFCFFTFCKHILSLKSITFLSPPFSPLFLVMRAPTSSPPPDDLSAERRSRRDLSPLSRRVTTDAGGGDSFAPNREPLGPGRRSLSATSQFRSKSPPRRAFSPVRNESSDGGGAPLPRAHRSATVTPQGSPKKRQLPIVPPARERLSQVKVNLLE